MLLVHQTGSLKIGEVIRYTLTYTPSADRILPPPAHLHVKVKNAAAIPLRAAYLHGPYTLHVATYPSTFNPNQKLEHPRRDGVPDFEPFLKAGGHWSTKLTVPDYIRGTGNSGSPRSSIDGSEKSVTWIIEITSQILFSTSATVSYELLVGRDSRSLDLGFAAVTGHGHGEIGQVQDNQQGKRRQEGHHAAQPKGVYSKAVQLVVEDTASLWNKPALPEWKNQKSKADEEIRRKLDAKHNGRKSHDAKKWDAASAEGEDQLKKDHETKPGRKRKIHLVMLTHGLHSNVGADMLYLKESIDATAKQARESAKKRKRQRNTEPEPYENQSGPTKPEVSSTAPLTGGQEEIDEDDEDDEQIIVRGFSGNVVRTERGIQYLGKRLAKYIFYLTYPDQPFLPVKRSLTRSFSSKRNSGNPAGPAAHSGSSVHEPGGSPEDLAYTFTSISFIGHSLGGLVQTYAIAYIQKHSPQFFDQVKPVNFVTMASPLLGLSNENPVYVKFALDFGLVGRTGQDLGLTWRAPTIARHGWTAMVAGLGAGGHKDHKPEDPRSKPLLRILPTGPAHKVLKNFRNRTVYSNVVNDGIVPLRTSCLLFLDWRGLGKVEKARRQNGLIETVAGWGWAELTGANSAAHASRAEISDVDEESRYGTGPNRTASRDTVPQPGISATSDDTNSQRAKDHDEDQFLDGNYRRQMSQDEVYDSDQSKQSSDHQPTNPFLNWLPFFKPKDSKSYHQNKKTGRAYTRGQTLKPQSEGGDVTDSDGEADKAKSQRPRVSRGDSIVENSNSGLGPPRTTVFEAAGDLLNPPLPPLSWLVDPSTRPRTIFHDCVYHPEDIPPLPMRQPSRLTRSFSSNPADSSEPHNKPPQLQNSDSPGSMKVEERIARAYHRDMSWRKVLVRLEPDAHNNIVVRRMFANAYGWPVIKHLCDTHFADTYSATTRDEDEPSKERAKDTDEAVGEEGEEVQYQRDKKPPPRAKSETREARDELTDLESRAKLRDSMCSTTNRHTLKGEDSAEWDDKYFDGTDDEDTEDDDQRGPIQRFLSSGTSKQRQSHSASYEASSKATAKSRVMSTIEAADNLSPPRPVEGHRGLGPSFNSEQTVPMATGDPETIQPTRIDVDDETDSAGESPRSPGAMTELGLRKPVEEQLSSPSGADQRRMRGRSGSQGLAEHVARLSMAAKQ